MVITKGSGRIAEVAARFSLDAMPGKQMAIDSELSAGAITEKVARVRRRELEEESGFYGAMDGAAKFVRGDAIASLMITVINIIGGLAIGLIRHGMAFSDAAATFTTLTVGDGAGVADTGSAGLHGVRHRRHQGRHRGCCRCRADAATRRQSETDGPGGPGPPSCWR